MGIGTVLGVDRSAAGIPGGITAPSEGMLRTMVALIKAGCDVTRYWHWRALHTLGFVCVEEMSISHRSIKMAIFAVFALCDYKREKRGRVSDSVIPLRVFPVSVVIVISSLDFSCE